MSKDIQQEPVILRGGACSGVMVLDIERIYIYKNTGRREYLEVKRGWWGTARIFEIDFRAMRENFNYEFVI